MKYVILSFILLGSLALAGGFDVGVAKNLSQGGYSGFLGFYVEGNPLAARGRLVFGEGGGLMGGLDLLYRPLGDLLIEPYLGAGAETLIARQKSVGGLEMAVGAESYAVGTVGLALRLARMRPYVEFSYCYGATPFSRVGLGLVWTW